MPYTLTEMAKNRSDNTKCWHSCGAARMFIHPVGVSNGTLWKTVQKFQHVFKSDPAISFPREMKTPLYIKNSRQMFSFLFIKAPN